MFYRNDNDRIWFYHSRVIMNDWMKEFNLSETQKAEIFGVGLWPFAISIVLFSLFIDKIGYKPAMIFAFFMSRHFSNCHFECKRLLGALRWKFYCRYR